MKYEDLIKQAFIDWVVNEKPVFTTVQTIISLICLLGSIGSIVSIWFFPWWWKSLISFVCLYIVAVKIIGQFITNHYLLPEFMDKK